MATWTDYRCYLGLEVILEIESTDDAERKAEAWGRRLLRRLRAYDQLQADEPVDVEAVGMLGPYLFSADSYPAVPGRVGYQVGLYAEFDVVAPDADAARAEAATVGERLGGWLGRDAQALGVPVASVVVEVYKLAPYG